jgi:hypothetical protein
MNDATQPLRKRIRGKWFFLWTFAFSCVLFWWLPSILFRYVVHWPDDVDVSTIWISVAAALIFAGGYLVPWRQRPVDPRREPMMDACCSLAYHATLLLFVPAVLAAMQLGFSRTGTVYGSGPPIPRPYQALWYTHLFFGFMFLGSAEPRRIGWRPVVTASILLTLPRLIVSLHGSRFFLAQAVVPALLIAYGRGWMRFSFKRFVQLALAALFLVFVPSITRGDAVLGQQDSVRFFAAGSSLQLFQDNMDLDLAGHCPPLLVSLTAKTIPYGPLGVCTLEISGLKNMPATLGRILTINDPATLDGTVAGTGSNYLLDLYLAGGLAAVYIGSALFGFSCRLFVGWVGRRSLFSGIWAECLTRALFAPRNDLGYVYERIPSLVLATLLVVFAVWAVRLLRIEYTRSAWSGRTLESAP